jgi:phasin family protein
MNEPSEQMEKVTQNLMQACDEVNANCCKSVDAMVEATAAMSKGYEEFSRKLGTLVQESVAKTMSAGKTMMSARNIQDMATLQTEFMKEFFDSWMTGAGRLSEISTRVTQEAIEPVARHANETMSKAAQQAQQAQQQAGRAA